MSPKKPVRRKSGLPPYLQAREQERRRQSQALVQNPFGQARFLKSCHRLEDLPPVGLPEFVFSGRSNVGKSSLINALCGQKSLARVSSVPGKTRQILYIEVPQRCLFTDLPGYGYARVSQQEKAGFSQLIDQYFQSERPLELILHLMDLRHSPSEEDQLMLDYLAQQGLPHVLLLTKADKLSASQRAARKLEQAQLLGLAAEDIFLISEKEPRLILALRDFLESRLRI